MDDLTDKIKDIAGKLTGDQPGERSPDTGGDYDRRDSQFESSDPSARRDYQGDETIRGAGSEPYPPVRPDMTRPAPPQYRESGPGAPPGDVEGEDTTPLA